MIPAAHVHAWQEKIPWTDIAQVEQDLILSRAVVALFSDSESRGLLAFRGGTALHKLHLAPAARYSEDIDLVQRVVPEPGKGAEFVYVDWTATGEGNWEACLRESPGEEPMARLQLREQDSGRSILEQAWIRTTGTKLDALVLNRTEATP